MGLRFRRSVKICDGLKLNFGKTGMSMTVGSGPLKKTFNTNGNVTTTVGLPGTGIYWTETERRSSRNNRSHTLRQNKGRTQSPQSDFQIPTAVNDYFSQPDVMGDDEPTRMVESNTSVSMDNSDDLSNAYALDGNQFLLNDGTPAEKNGLSADDIKRLYMYSDAPVDWTELIAGTSADELFMDPAVYSYCVQMASRVLSGDVEAYLEVIERMRPVDDLALYSGDFEFGTDSPSYVEVEFCAYPERVLSNGSSDVLLEEFISAVAVRVARDLMALLPVSKVLIHIDVGGNTILSVIFTRSELHLISFRNNLATDIVRIFPHLIVTNFKKLEDVGRLSV